RGRGLHRPRLCLPPVLQQHVVRTTDRDRKSTRLNSSHSSISYAVFCLKIIVVDTLARSLRGGYEMSAQAMARSSAVADRLRDQFDTAPVLVFFNDTDATKITPVSPPPSLPT